MSMETCIIYQSIGYKRLDRTKQRQNARHVFVSKTAFTSFHPEMKHLSAIHVSRRQATDLAVC